MKTFLKIIIVLQFVQLLYVHSIINMTKLAAYRKKKLMCLKIQETYLTCEIGYNFIYNIQINIY